MVDVLSIGHQKKTRSFSWTVTHDMEPYAPIEQRLFIDPRRVFLLPSGVVVQVYTLAIGLFDPVVRPQSNDEI